MSVSPSIPDNVLHEWMPIEAWRSYVAARDGMRKPMGVNAQTLAIRKLGQSLYECRTGLAWRLIFEAHKGVLIFDFAGDHDEVQNYLRGKR